MRKITFIILTMLIGSASFAQINDNISIPDQPKTVSRQPYKKNKRKACPVFYLNVSSGINNNFGLAGVGFDAVVAKSVTIGGGIGISTWGYKFCVDGIYYLKPCHRGWAFGGGVTYNGGLTNLDAEMKTLYGNTETVTLDLYPQANVFAAVYHFWSIGRRSNRLYLECGWSQRATPGDRFKETRGNPLSGSSIDELNLICPGGPIIGCGISFGKF